MIEYLYAEWKSHYILSLFLSPEHEAAMVKYSRLPKKRENEKVNIDVNAHLLCARVQHWVRCVCGQVKAEVVREVAYSRRKQHQAAMQYYCALNALQYRKKVAMLEPMLGFTHAQVWHSPSHTASRCPGWVAFENNTSINACRLGVGCMKK